MIRWILILSFFSYMQYCASQFSAVTRRLPKTHCDNPTKNSLVENFFNIIFSEFYTTPPVCVCVQMCAGQSTYCYPNGCLKTATAVREENKDASKMVETPSPHLQKNKNQFMLIKDEQFDFIGDLLKNNYVDDAKTVSQNLNNPVVDLHPDPFKDKYSMLAKYKRIPKVDFKHNINEKVKNAKSDLAKIENADLTKTRWPLNRSNRASAHKLFSDNNKPIINNSKFFKAMLHDNDVAEYPPKYFKRDLTKNTESDDIQIRSFYLLDNSHDAAENKSFSLEKLIDTLIRSSFNTEIDTITNLESDKRNETEIETKVPIETVVNVNSSLTNETTSVISMNFTNENVDKNKYADDSYKINKTGSLNEMITYLSKQIEIQNNTSMEIAKNIAGGLNGTTYIIHKSEKMSTTPELIPTSNGTSKPYNTVSTTGSLEEIEFTTLQPEASRIASDSTLHDESTTLYPEITTFLEIKATKKNRQRVVRKSTGSKIN